VSQYRDRLRPGEVLPVTGTPKGALAGFVKGIAKRIEREPGYAQRLTEQAERTRREHIEREEAQAEARRAAWRHKYNQRKLGRSIGLAVLADLFNINPKE
jgi:hypothetical protein